MAGSTIGADDDGRFIAEGCLAQGRGDLVDPDALAVEIDAVVRRDGDEQGVAIGDGFAARVGSFNFDAGIFHEDTRDDKKDQQDEYTIDHRSKIDGDRAVTVIGAGGFHHTAASIRVLSTRTRFCSPCCTWR